MKSAGSVSVQVLAYFLWCTLIQEIGITLAGIGNFNDAVGDDYVDDAPVWKVEG